VDSDKEKDDWDDKKYIWDREELEDINKKRDKDEMLPKILRNKDSFFGIRSNQDLTPFMCFKSMFIPWQNEFICTWIYLLFSIYFWVQLVMILIPTKDYDFSNKEDYECMALATIGICISLTMTTCYLIFYPINQNVYEKLETLNFMGVLVMVYMYSFAFFASEFTTSQSQYITSHFYILFLTVVLGMTCLVIVQYEIGRLLSICISGVFLGCLLVLDLLFMCTTRQMNVFHVPLIAESLFLGAGILLMHFNVPERWMKKTKVVNLYLNSHIIYALIIVNVIYELHIVLYYTLKVNSNYIGSEEEVSWYKVGNVYNTST
jgi:hypothetical protein